MEMSRWSLAHPIPFCTLPCPILLSIGALISGKRERNSSRTSARSPAEWGVFSLHIFPSGLLVSISDIQVEDYLSTHLHVIEILFCFLRVYMFNFLLSTIARYVLL